MLFLKLHKSYRSVVAICDEDLVGKEFEEGNKQLKITEHFFVGELVTKERAIEIMRFQANEDSTFNIVGKEAVDAAKEAGIINNEMISTVQDIPYALILL